MNNKILISNNSICILHDSSNILLKKSTNYKEDEKYIKNIIEKIKKIKDNETIIVYLDPNNIIYNNKCSITYKKDILSFIFCGKGSKKLSIVFVKETKNDPKYSYNTIIQIFNKNLYRQYIPIKSIKKIWNKFSDRLIKDRYINEVIISESPCKPYLDIEWKIEKLTNKEIKKSDNFINNIKDDIISIFYDKYKIKINEKNIMIMSSHSEKKISFHIIINKRSKSGTIVFNTNIKKCKNSAWSLWFFLTKKNDKYKNTIDESVYSKDREFRTLYSNKNHEFRPLVPYKTNINRNDIIQLKLFQCMKYMITYFKNNKCKIININDNIFKNEDIFKNKDIFKNENTQNINYLKKHTDNNKYINNKYISDKKIQYILNLAKKVHQTAFYTGNHYNEKGWRFSYHNKNELCYTGNKHKSNGFYVFEEKEYIYMKCMSGRCKTIKLLQNNIIKSLFKSIF